MKLVDKILLFVLFIFSRSWLSIISKNPVGVDAWDYLLWSKKSVLLGSLNHPPLHVPGFYALISLIIAYTGIDAIILYTNFFPIIGAICLWLSLKPILVQKNWGLLIATIYGFFVIRTAMIIPEWLGLIIIPSAILSLSLFVNSKNNSQKVSYGLIYAIITITTILAHHLSGGILLLVSFGYSIITKNRELLFSTVILSLIAIFAWSSAGSFPLRLTLMFLKLTFPYLIIILPVIYFLMKFKIPNIHPRYIKSIGVLTYAGITVLSFLIALSTGLPSFAMLYWLPTLIILPLSFIGIKSIDDSKSIDTKLQFAWTGIIFILIIGLSIFPLIRPLIARILVFEIQSAIPLIALGLSIVVNDCQYGNKKKKFALFFTCLILSLNLFHSYPHSLAWFRTEFRYYDEEVEIAVITGRWLGNENIVDTDNRIGVMYQSVSYRETTYGEYTESWLTNVLAVADNISTTPNNTAVLISFVMIEIGFMTGKFIHGKGGGANDVSIAFDTDILLFLTNTASKPVTSGQCSLWLYN